MKNQIAPVIGFAMAIGLVGCASGMASRELVDARSEYQTAQDSPGAKLSPVPLHDAKLALDAAEQASLDDSASERALGLSYVAGRKAKLAQSQGHTAESAAQKEQAKKDLAQLQAQDLANTKQGLQYTQGELVKTNDKLNMTAEQLAAEKTARAAADRRARDAMDKLGVAAALAIKEEPRGTVILLPGSILFASNKAELLPTAQAKLDAVAEALKNQDDRKMVVEGHTDSQGTEPSNLDLGQRRAQSVRDYLVSKGVKSESISASGIGQGRPIADNKSPEGRANNRRVEIVIQSIEKR
jgi:outer membrane protein OmpA-like peptidoglycan-associated protein